jgi:dihydroneopterin aldolase
MDKIIVSDLEVYAYHGVAAEEKKLGQMFLVSVEVSLPLENAASTGNIDETINYAQLCDLIKDVLLSKSHDLIESAAMHIISAIFRQFRSSEMVKVLLKKPWAPMGHHLRYAAVEIVRRREDRCEW